MINDIPETLDEAIDTILSRMSETDKAWVRDPANSTASLHHGFGTGLRNDWGLWDKDSPMSRWFRAKGIWHGDDMSSIILGAVQARVRGCLFDVEAEAKRYEAFWRDSGLGFDGEPIQP